VSAATANPVRLAGELTVQTAAQHKDTLLSALETGNGVTLDLSDVSELDTAGLQLLLLLKREAAQLGKTLGLLAPSEPVQDVLRLARLDLHLNHSEDR